MVQVGQAEQPKKWHFVCVFSVLGNDESYNSWGLEGSGELCACLSPRQPNKSHPPPPARYISRPLRHCCRQPRRQHALGNQGQHAQQGHTGCSCSPTPPEEERKISTSSVVVFLDELLSHYAIQLSNKTARVLHVINYAHMLT